MVGEPGEAVTVEALDPPPRVSKITATTTPAAPAMTATLAHLLDHQVLCFCVPSPTNRVTFVMEIVASPSSFPRDTAI